MLCDCSIREFLVNVLLESLNVVLLMSMVVVYHRSI